MLTGAATYFVCLQLRADAAAEMEGQRQATRAELDAERTAAAAEAAVAAGEADKVQQEAEARLAEATSQYEAVTAQLQQCQAADEEAQRQLAAVRSEVAAVKKEHEAALGALAATKEEHAGLLTRVAEAEAERDAAADSLQHIHDAHQSLHDDMERQRVQVRLSRPVLKRSLSVLSLCCFLHTAAEFRYCPRLPPLFLCLQTRAALTRRLPHTSITARCWASH